MFWLVYLTLLYTNSELTLIKQSTFATTVCDSPAKTSYADCAPHISSSLLKCWVSLHYLNFEGVGFLEPKVQQPTAANAKCSRHSPAKVEYFAPLQISDIFQHCLYCIFCCPAIIEYLAIHPISDILHQYQIWISNTSARVEYFASLTNVEYYAPLPRWNIFIHCQGELLCTTFQVILRLVFLLTKK